MKTIAVMNQKGGTGKHDDVLERVGAGHVYLQGECR